MATTNELSRSERKRRAILAAAEALFLRNGYLGTSMDELAELSEVSKQTVYAHFGSKESLFVELVSSMTAAAGDGLHDRDERAALDGDVAGHLARYAADELAVVMTPRVLKLRRLVIGEVERFPDLARALYENGPERAIRSLAVTMAEFTDRGLLAADDPVEAATTFNWLVMGAPMNEAMLLGDEAIPDVAALQRHAAHAARVFVAAYGVGVR
ncbi:TetR family transcriptional regulator [Agromyces sp. Root81]|uniref:TetR/AcrR family transcriptional regulator n=1 Tax=Agromyces sp. Root81 TaxID=1736601 RepID=UPI000700B991|nr:TetR/AcrR family transcriptional regulator [Agromyces sp. Root81]KRC59103.1 TetR family transcriptional regulator [Agromyces sp. Root81]